MLTRWASTEPGVAQGWTLQRHTSPSGLYGAAGMSVGDDGLLYVVQHYGSQVNTIDIKTGDVTVAVPKGGQLPAPDDLAFDHTGTMFVTQPQYDRVTMRRPDGTTKVIADARMANGIAVHDDRIFVNETVPGDGRILEVFADGRQPRVVTEELTLANGQAIGPDGRIYWPEMASGEIRRVSMDGGRPECFLSGLAMPTAVKFSPAGLLTAVCAGNGDVVQSSLTDPRAQIIARMRSGQDNLAFDPHGRLFVSHFIDGGVAELSLDGRPKREVVAPGFLFPFALAITPSGSLYAADGMSLRAIGSDGAVTRAGTWLEEGFPGWVRSVAPGPGGTVFIASSSGSLVEWAPDVHSGKAPLATDLQEVLGLAWSADTGVWVAEGGTGRLLRIADDGTTRTLSEEARRPSGLALTDGGCFVADEARGRVLHVDDNGDARQLCSDLDRPQGIALSGGRLFVLDAGRRELSAVDVASGGRSVLVTDLPVGDPPGVSAPVLPGMGAIGLNGPLSSFAGLAVASDGSVYISADGEGSILRLRPAG